jgi:hypothetical protein
MALAKGMSTAPALSASQPVYYFGVTAPAQLLCAQPAHTTAAAVALPNPTILPATNLERFVSAAEESLDDDGSLTTAASASLATDISRTASSGIADSDQVGLMRPCLP